MKTIKKLFFSTFALILYSGLLSIASSSGNDIQKTYTWNYKINKDATVILNNYDCNIVIHIWDKDETEYHLSVDAKTRSDEDAEVLEKYLQDLIFSHSSNSVSFKNIFWQSRNSVMGLTTMKLDGGKKVELSEFEIKGELWVPSGINLELNSKYSEINMESLSGPLTLNLYNDNLYGSNLGSKAEITDKYSTIEFKNTKDIKANLYNSRLDADNTGNLSMESKYSKVTIETSGNLDVNGYNDKYSFLTTGDITFVAKYSDLKTETSGHVNFNCYEGNFYLKVIKDVEINSKYADYQFETAENCSISSSYNDKLTVGKLNSLRIIDSKYCIYKIDELVSALSETNGYEDKFNILRTGQEFKEMNVNGKYVDVSLALLKSMDFRFKAEITYADLDIDESSLKPIIKIINGSKVEYNAIKGTETEGMTLIELNGYQMGLKIINL